MNNEGSWTSESPIIQPADSQLYHGSDEEAVVAPAPGPGTAGPAAAAAAEAATASPGAAPAVPALE